MRPTEDRRIEERRTDDLTPIREQRDGDDRRGSAQPVVSPWRRKQLEQFERLGYVAVADLTGKAA